MMKFWLIALTLLLSRPAWAQDPAAVVPVAKAAFHVPVMQNDWVTVLNVYIPPNRASGYHRHERDSVGVLLADAERTGQNHGDSKIVLAARRPRGSTSFTFYSKQPNAHNVATTGSSAFHNIVIELRQPAPAGNSAGTREGAAGYTQIMDNTRVRGWRLVLEPGQSAPAITQSAPGIRVVIEGGEIVESVPGQPDRGMAPKVGEFYWQDAGITRTVRNNGMSRIEFVEFEFK